jgi:hypothetical protein
MASKEVEKIQHDWSAQAAVFLFVALVTWWWALFAFDLSVEDKRIWGATYQIMAFWGGIWGLFIAKGWGGIKSVMGRAIIAFAVGLLMQVFGQSVFSFYNIFLAVEVPYPSLADIGYFGSIPFYIYGIFNLARASGIHISLKSFKNQLLALTVPLVGLWLSYSYFLVGYEFDWSDPMRVFLDFGYPLGQAFYVSLALLTFLLSKKTLGGIMKNKVLFILLSLAVQYAADYNFLYQAYAGTWGVSEYGDVLYLVAYLFMALGLIQLKPQFIKTK